MWLIQRKRPEALTTRLERIHTTNEHTVGVPCVPPYIQAELFEVTIPTQNRLSKTKSHGNAYNVNCLNLWWETRVLMNRRTDEGVLNCR